LTALRNGITKKLLEQNNLSVNHVRLMLAWLHAEKIPQIAAVGYGLAGESKTHLTQNKICDEGSSDQRHNADYCSNQDDSPA
jgi:hypothetical protein